MKKNEHNRNKNKKQKGKINFNKKKREIKYVKWITLNYHKSDGVQFVFIYSFLGWVGRGHLHPKSKYTQNKFKSSRNIMIEGKF